MTNNKNDGGPAFPRTAFVRENQRISNGPQEGMSLRDHFAAKAMAAFIREKDTECGFDNIALCAYAMADAMLRERYALEES